MHNCQSWAANCLWSVCPRKLSPDVNFSQGCLRLGREAFPSPFTQGLFGKQGCSRSACIWKGAGLRRAFPCPSPGPGGGDEGSGFTHRRARRTRPVEAPPPEMLEGLRSSLRLTLARGPRRWQPAPLSQCAGAWPRRPLSRPAARCVPPPLSAAPRSRSLPMASPTCAAAALARQVPEPGCLWKGGGLDPGSPKPAGLVGRIAGVSCTILLRRTSPFRLHPGVSSLPNPNRNLDLQPANSALERPLPASSSAQPVTRSGARRGQPRGT